MTNAMRAHEYIQAIASRLSEKGREYWNGMDNGGRNESITEAQRDGVDAAVATIEELAKPHVSMTTINSFNGKNYSIEQTSDYQFVLVHPTSENETFDSFEELVEAHPICEEARSFFFANPELHPF